MYVNVKKFFSTIETMAWIVIIIALCTVVAWTSADFYMEVEERMFTQREAAALITAAVASVIVGIVRLIYKAGGFN